MKFFVLVYFLISISVAYGALKTGGFAVAFSILGASFFGWFAGCGFKGSVLVGGKITIFGGALLAGIALGIAHYLADNFIVVLFDITFGGGSWYLLGALIGFITTNKKDTEDA